MTYGGETTGTILQLEEEIVDLSFSLFESPEDELAELEGQQIEVGGLLCKLRGQEVDRKILLVESITLQR
jgi:hypothetical protein